jgi:hypothetical protein
VTQATTYCEAKLIAKRGPTVNGWFARFEIEMPSGPVRSGNQRFLREPQWKIGDTLMVCLLPDGQRFFPRDLNQHADMGKIDH